MKIINNKIVGATEAQETRLNSCEFLEFRSPSDRRITVFRSGDVFAINHINMKRATGYVAFSPMFRTAGKREVLK